MFRNDKRFILTLFSIFSLLTILFVLAAHLVFNSQKNSIKQELYSELTSVSEMKVNDIIRWREERISDIKELTEGELFAEDVNLWFNNPGNEKQKNNILLKISSLVKFNRYSNIQLFDALFDIKLNTNNEDTSLNKNVRNNFIHSCNIKEVVFGDFYECDICGKVHLDMVAPLIFNNKIIGGILLRIEKENFLYPLIHSWPIPSNTAESFLVEKEGNNVVFLNELKRRKNSILKFKIPINDSTSNIPAVMAAKGIEGIVEGIDYSGVPVLAYIKRIPGTPWIKVAKIDKDEVFYSVKEKGIFIGLFTGIIILFTGVGLIWSWKSHKKALRLQKAEDELHHQARINHLEYLVKYSNDIFILSDEKLNIIEVNETAVDSYGYSLDEFHRMNISELIADDSSEKIEFIREKLKVTNKILFENVHRKKDNSLFPVEVSLRVINIGGNIYHQRIIRDISERKKIEEDLRQSEEQFRKLVNNSPYCVHQINLKGELISMNKAGLDMMGVKNESEIIGMKYLDAVSEEDKERVGNLLELALDNQPSQFEFKASNFKYFASSFVPIKDEEGNIIRLMGTTRDITERKQLIEKLEKLNEEILDLYNNAPCGYHSLDSNGTFVKINDTELNWLGYNRDEVIGIININDILSEQSKKIFTDKFNIFLNQGYIKDVEMEFVKKDGTTFFVNIDSTALFDEKGKYKYSRTIVSDISERKITQQKLSQSLQYWNDTFNSIKDHIWILDKDGTILQCNKSSEETFYQQVCDITGNKCYKIMHDSESFTSDCPFQEMCKSFKREVRELLRDGKTYSITVDPIFDEDGKYNGAVHIMSDITDLKKAESQMRDFAAHLQKVREEERTSLARTLHDNFGQLLTGLKMEVSVMEKAIGKLINFNRIPDLSDKIKTIKSVLDDSVALTGKISMELRPSILDNFGLIPAVEWLVSDFSKKSGIKCNLICGIEELNLNKSHCTEIFRIIQESLTNVVRHANATLVNIRIELLNEYYEIEIEDNGKGITQDEIKSPMAMGLLGMKERTVIFNGKIEISGKPGKGTKIVLKIPKEKND